LRTSERRDAESQPECRQEARAVEGNTATAREPSRQRLARPFLTPHDLRITPTPMEDAMTRYGSVLRLQPEAYGEYKRLHAAVWPEILAMISACNIRNYSIYHKDGWLFSYFEYHGTDYEADMARMSADPNTKRWWAVCMPLQEPLVTRAEGEWWASMEELFHLD
jgi:L-rhamnose mutarotase